MNPSHVFRRSVAIVMVAAMATTIVHRTGAQPLVVDDTFAPLLIDERAGALWTTLRPLAGGGFLAQGPFEYVDGVPLANVARLDAAGRHDPTIAFEGDLPSEATLFPLFGGQFLAVQIGYDDVAQQSTVGFARHRADGSIDSGFTPFGISSGALRNVQIAPDGRVLVSGQFAEIAGVARQGLARLQADGTLDAAFAPTLLGPTTDVMSLAVDDNGAVIVSAYATAPATDTTLLGRFFADGSRDAAFAPVRDPAPFALPPGVLAALPGGKVLVTGSPAVRLNADGTVDASFAPEIPARHVIVQAVPFADGRLLVLERERASSSRPPLFLNQILLLGADGRVLVDYGDALAPGRSLFLEAMTADQDLIVWHGLPVPQLFGYTAAKETNTSLSLPAPYASFLTDARFSRMRLDGTLDATFAPQLGIAGSVARLAAGPQDTIVISGEFSRVNGEERAGLARLRNDGSLDSGFAVPSELGKCQLALTETGGTLLVHTDSGLRRLRVDGAVDSSLLVGSDLAAPEVTLHTLDAAGHIIASRPGPGLGEFLLARYDAAGRLLAQFTPAFLGNQDYGIINGAPAGGTTTASLNDGYADPITEVLALPDGGLLVRGDFHHVAGQPVPGVARLNADGTVDATFQRRVPDANTAFAIALQSGGGTLFRTNDQLHGVSQTATVRILADGSVDPTFRTLPDASLERLQELDDGTLLAMTFYADITRWSADGVKDLNFIVILDPPVTLSTAVLDALTTPAGELLLAGQFTGVNGVACTGLARLVPQFATGITVQPAATTVIAGQTAWFQVAIGDPGEVTFQWQRDGRDLPGETRACLFLDFASAAQAGAYRVVIRAGGATYVSDAATLTVNPSDARLANFSARSRVRSDALPPIAGFVTRSHGVPHPVLLRAIELNLTNAYAQQVAPRLGVFSGPVEIASDTGSARAPALLTLSRDLGAFDPPLWQPVPGIFLNQDAALALEVGGGCFTAQTSATNPGTAVCLFEFYDAALGPTPGSLLNASLRGRTAPRIDTMIGGFVITGDDGPLTLLLRVVGSELSQWNVSDALADPQLVLFDRWGFPIARNDDWELQTGGDLPALRAATQSAGAFDLAPGSKSAALLVSLAPGLYTMHATASTATGPAASVRDAGEVLLEIYVLPE